MAVIQFKDLGRDKYSGSINISNGLSGQEISEIACEVASKHLLSREIEAEYDIEKNTGVITVGGWRPVGSFCIAN